MATGQLPVSIRILSMEEVQQAIDYALRMRCSSWICFRQRSNRIFAGSSRISYASLSFRKREESLLAETKEHVQFATSAAAGESNHKNLRLKWIQSRSVQNPGSCRDGVSLTGLDISSGNGHGQFWHVGYLLISAVCIRMLHCSIKLMDNAEAGVELNVEQNKFLEGTWYRTCTLERNPLTYLYIPWALLLQSYLSPEHASDMFRNHEDFFIPMFMPCRRETMKTYEKLFNVFSTKPSQDFHRQNTSIVHHSAIVCLASSNAVGLLHHHCHHLPIPGLGAALLLSQAKDEPLCCSLAARRNKRMGTYLFDGL